MMAVVTADSTAKMTAKRTAEAKIDSRAAVAMMTTTMAINRRQIIDYYLVSQSGRGRRVMLYLGYLFLPYFWYR